jgi:AcrR family transcriptional regulator
MNEEVFNSEYIFGMSLDAAVSSTPSRGERRRERTRRRLLEAGRALIARKGVEGLRIAEITERADVALGSFYNHFQSKEELVEAVVEETIAAMARRIDARMARLEDPADAVAYATRAYVRVALEDRELAGLLVNLERADAHFLRAVEPYALGALERGIRAGRFEVADPRLSLIGIIGATLAVMRAILDGRYGADAERLHAETVLRAIGLEREAARAVAQREPL